jgi:hypothetical protein
VSHCRLDVHSPYDVLGMNKAVSSWIRIIQILNTLKPLHRGSISLIGIGTEPSDPESVYPSELVLVHRRGMYVDMEYANNDSVAPWVRLESGGVDHDRALFALDIDEVLRATKVVRGVVKSGYNLEVDAITLDHDVINVHLVGFPSGMKMAPGVHFQIIDKVLEKDERCNKSTKVDHLH